MSTDTNHIQPDSPPSVSSAQGTLPGRPRSASSLNALLIGTAIGCALLIPALALAPLARACTVEVISLVGGSAQEAISESAARKELRSLDRSVTSLEHHSRLFVPSAAYIVVSTSDNTFVLKRGADELRRSACSTGSFTLLRSVDKTQEWIFTTPRGRLRVEQKEVSPVWDMPDWAFIEDGKPIPPVGSSERRMFGVLGDYALHLGDGYLIHGTLYQRYLGLAVTHGCVRLGDDDLKAVFEALEVGSKVFIY